LPQSGQLRRELIPRRIRQPRWLDFVAHVRRLVFVLSFTDCDR
jgi:hypothetical protein